LSLFYKNIEKIYKTLYLTIMFNAGDIVKVLIPNVVNSGYDYRLSASAAINENCPPPEGGLSAKQTGGEQVPIGTFVRVAVMNRPYIGVIIGPGDSNLPPEKIKPAAPIADDWRLTADDIGWLFKMSEWTMMSPGAVLRLIINVPDAFAPPKTEQLYAFQTDEKIRMTAQRQAVADAFASNDGEPMSASDIQNIARVSAAVVRTMINNGILANAGAQALRPGRSGRAPAYFDTKSVVLNEEQQAAADQLAALSSGFSVALLDGITGSGKTQVYFDSAWRAYAAGRSVLLMMPEIALTAQFMNRFENRFGARPVVWHSNLTTARRREIWRGVASGEIRMVVGTRSALFLPWQNLGPIVVDEEHDGSYKQEDMGNYHARDMAILRAKISGFPVILASATPSAETIKNAQAGRYRHLRLTSRFGGAQMPAIETIDMRKEKVAESGNLSPTLCEAIRETLSAGQQAMLFINRRGFAPIVQCKKCGWVATCPDCSVGMTMHKGQKDRWAKGQMGGGASIRSSICPSVHSSILLCHICGRSMPMPASCPDCAGDISMRGAGLEKIQEEVQAKFPDAKTALVSSDTMMSRQALERLVAQMESGEIDIVIGTQILAKGHHFPNLTLVGVVDADMGLFGPDFRAGEHTFQQLFQVAGRAGRGEKPGRVLMQTFQPDHPVMRAICNGDRDAFMARDMESRRTAQMPPLGN